MQRVQEADFGGRLPGVRAEGDRHVARRDHDRVAVGDHEADGLVHVHNDARACGGRIAGFRVRMQRGRCFLAAMRTSRDSVSRHEPAFWSSTRVAGSKLCEVHAVALQYKVPRKLVEWTPSGSATTGRSTSSCGMQ